MTDTPRLTPEDGAPAPDSTNGQAGAPRDGGYSRNREPRLVTPRGTPVSRFRITLHTEFAQRVYRRTWDRLKADLYVLTVRTRMADQNEASTAIEAIIEEAFRKARTDLAADLERTEVLRDHAQIKEFPEYDDRLEAVATFSTPRAREFLTLIQQMDQLLMLYDALWLAGFAETNERVHRSQNWQRRLTKITNRLRELANRTRVSLSRQADRPLSDASAEGAVAGMPADAPGGAPGEQPLPDTAGDSVIGREDAEDEDREGEVDPFSPSHSDDAESGGGLDSVGDVHAGSDGSEGLSKELDESTRPEGQAEVRVNGATRLPRVAEAPGRTATTRAAAR